MVLTPQDSHGNVSRSSSASRRGSLAPKAIASLPFCFPRSCLDRERYFSGRGPQINLCAELLIAPEEHDSKPASLRSLTISGLGGCGKTELAYQFVARYCDKFDVVLIVKADTTSRLTEEYDQIATSLGLIEENDHPSSDECREILKTWFKTPYGAGGGPQIIQSSVSQQLSPTNRSETRILKWLLILDNAENWTTIDPYWPDKGNGSVLVTSRRPNILPQFQPSGTTGRLELEFLPMEEAAAVLKYYSGSENDHSSSNEEAALSVALRLEGLPLAVMQVGSYIKQCRTSIARFLEIHQTDSDFHCIYLERDTLGGYERNLESIWGLESLSLEQNTSREAYTVLCVLAFLDPEEVQDDLLRPDTTRCQMPDYPTNESALYQRLKLLINTSLLERGTKESAVSIHRMVQKVTRAKVAQERALSEMVFGEVLARLMFQWPYIDRVYKIGTQGHTARWSRCSKLLPHILALSQGYLELRQAHKLSGPYLGFVELLCEACGYVVLVHLKCLEPI